MEKFAKLFEDKEIGQVLVKKDSDETGQPEIRYFFTPQDLGVCYLAIQFKDNDEGWDSLDRAFEKVDAVQAAKVVSKALNEAGL